MNPAASSIVGRDAERASLEDAARAAAAGDGRFLVLDGDAGIGKTTLARALADRVVADGFTIGEGHAYAVGSGAYAPIGEALRRLGRDLPHETALSKTAHLEAIVALFTSLAAAKPTMVVLEDLHWADRATLDVVDALAAAVGGARLLVVVTTRLAGEPTWFVERLERLAASSRVERLHLGPLDAHARQLLVDRYLAAAANRGVRLAVERFGEGNPFHMTEMLRGLLERPHGTLRPYSVDMVAHVRRDIVRRLDVFSAADRGTFAQAALIGRAFDAPLLAAATDVDRASIERILQQAAELGLVERDGDAWSFRHAITREAIASEAMSLALRPFHARVASALEAEAGAPHESEQLAFHWRAAGDDVRASAYDERAGDLAAKGFAHDDAVEAYERAVASLPEASRDAVRLLLKIGRHSVMAGSNDAALDAFERAASAAIAARDEDGEAQARAHVALQRYRSGDPAPLRDVEAMLARVPSAEMRLLVALAQVAALQYRPDVARRYAQRVDAARLVDPDLRHDYAKALGITAYLDGDLPALRRAQAAYERAAEHASDPAAYVTALYNGGWSFAALGASDDADSRFAHASALATRHADRIATAATSAMRASLLLDRGDLAGVRAELAIVDAQRTDSVVANAHAAAWGTLAGLHLGDDALIATWFERRERTISPFGAALYAAGYAEILIRRNRRAEATAMLARAVANKVGWRGLSRTLIAAARYGDPATVASARAVAAHAANARSPVAEVHTLALIDALSAQRANDDVVARKHALRAARGFAEMHVALLAAAAYEVADRIDDARAIYERVGARGDLARIAAASGATGLSASLTARERAIASCVGRGLTNAAIAAELSISEKTVEKHLSAAYVKLGVSSRALLAARIAGTLAAGG